MPLDNLKPADSGDDFALAIGASMVQTSDLRYLIAFTVDSPLSSFTFAMTMADAESFSDRLPQIIAEIGRQISLKESGLIIPDKTG